MSISDMCGELHFDRHNPAIGTFHDEVDFVATVAVAQVHHAGFGRLGIYARCYQYN